MNPSRGLEDKLNTPRDRQRGTQSDGHAGWGQALHGKECGEGGTAGGGSCLIRGEARGGGRPGGGAASKLLRLKPATDPSDKLLLLIIIVIVIVIVTIISNNNTTIIMATTKIRIGTTMLVTTVCIHVCNT